MWADQGLCQEHPSFHVQVQNLPANAAEVAKSGDGNVPGENNEDFNEEKAIEKRSEVRQFRIDKYIFVYFKIGK